MQYVKDLLQVYIDLDKISKAPVYNNLKETMKSDMKNVIRSFIEKYLDKVGYSYNNIAAHAFNNHNKGKPKYYDGTISVRGLSQTNRNRSIRLNMSYLRGMDDIIFSIRSILSKYFDNKDLIQFIKDEILHDVYDYESYNNYILLFTDPNYSDIWELHTVGSIKNISEDLSTNYDIVRYYSKILMRLYDNLIMKYFYKYEYIGNHNLEDISIKIMPTLTYGYSNTSDNYFVFNFYNGIEPEYITDAKYYVDDLKNHSYNLFKLKW